MNDGLFELAKAIDKNAELTWNFHLFSDNTPDAIKMYSYITGKTEKIDFIKDKNAKFLESIGIRDFLNKIGLNDERFVYYATLDTRSKKHNEIINLAATYSIEPLEWTNSTFAEWMHKGDDYIHNFKIDWIKTYKQVIKDAAAKYNIPALLLSGTAYIEVGGDPMWIDGAAYTVYGMYDEARASRVSFGYVSMQVRVAAETLGYGTSPTQRQIDETIQSLNNPIENIYIAAAHLSDLRDVDFKGITNMTDAQISITAQRYNVGASVSYKSIKKYHPYGDRIMKNKSAILVALK